MSLFQKSVEKKYLNELDSVLIDQKYKAFQNYFGNPSIQENIRNSKEEQFQEGFLRELFVSIFGYTLNPQTNFNLTTELKNIANSKKADGAILSRGHAPVTEQYAIAVIELKGTDTTDLDKIESQAFGYKNHHPKCVYVISSNFEKLRFYIQNAVDHIDFDLFNLSREQFSLMWLCLAKDNLLNGLPQKIKELSLLQEENITKKLYADYSKFREAIYNNLVKNNPETDKLLLFKKTQKLLDRFLFIFFAEDRLLLPPNSISEIVKQWTTLKDEMDEYVPLYDRFKKYFGYMNTGYKGKKYDIYAYNGGLFAPDEILDKVSIDDEILHKHTLTLSQYDFETDVDVNILGHIFEHSLGEIENVQAEITATAATGEYAPLTKQNKRKKDGIFYTPKYITKYIVENTVGRLCKEKRKELKIIDEEYAKGRKNRKKEIITALDNKLTEYRNWLMSITILDPACGSGAFLNQALDFLIIEHRKIDDLRAQLFGSALVFSDITTDILEKNIYGVDLNDESVEIAKLSLWLRTAQKGRKLNTLNNNIKCGNSLIDDPEVAGEKAFNWQKEFPNIFREKEKKAWHVTTATHNSRYSQRMFNNHVVRGEAEWLDTEDEIIITQTVLDIVIADRLNVLEYNICGDHMHILLVCEEEELSKMVGKLKSVSAKIRNRKRGYTAESSTAAATRGYAPLSEDGDGDEAEDDDNTKRGETQRQVWTQKFGKSEIKDEKYLANAIEYIRNNRKKHELPEIKEIEKLKKELLCTLDHAFRHEYKGGFDVVIGNPPYVQVNDLFYTNYQTQKCGDLYAFFFEKGINILKQNGYFSFITPSLFIKGMRYDTLRNFLLLNTTIIEILDKGDKIFQDVQMPTAITTLKKAKRENQDWNKFISGNDLLEKLRLNSSFIKDFSKIMRGLEIGKDKVLNEISDVQFLTGEDIFRYGFYNYSYIDKFTYEEFKKDNFFFGGNRVIIRETGNRITTFFLSDNVTQQNRSLYSIKIVDENEFNPLYILAILNSQVIQFYYKAKFAANTDIFPKIRIGQVKELPIKKIILLEQKNIIEKAGLMISLNNDLQDIIHKFQRMILRKFNLTDFPNKIKNWHLLTYSEFIKEIDKKKIKLSLSEEAEWEEYFQQESKKTIELRNKINITDKEIDQMVYELYGLTDEEIKIVEGTV